MFEKNEFLRNISFSAHLLSSLKVLQIFVIIRNAMTLRSASVYLDYLVKYQSLSQPWALTILAPPVNKIKITWTISSSYKALMTSTGLKPRTT